MSGKELDPTALERLAERRLGLNLTRGGTAQALARHAGRLGAGLSRLLERAEAGPESSEFQALVEAVTVQHSWLFRDRQQLELAIAGLRSGAQVWVPATARGEDAYSIAILSDAVGRPASVLGTDICAAALEHARRARYDAWATREVPPSHAGALRWEPTGGQIVERIRGLVRFELHNLLDPPRRSPAPDGKWDLILCRNVLIYLTREHAQRVVARLRDALATGGMLALGASDILAELPPGLAPVVHEGRVFFRRLGEGTPPDPTPCLHVPPAHARSAVTSDPRRSGRAAPSRAQGTVVPRVAAPAGASAPAGAPRSGEGGDAAAGREPGGAVAGDLAARQQEAEAAHRQLFEGIERYLAGDLPAAVKELRAALFHLPGCWPAAYYLALTHDALGRFDEARRLYAEVCSAIDRGTSASILPGHDFSFLEQDVAAVARRRARES